MSEERILDAIQELRKDSTETRITLAEVQRDVHLLRTNHYAHIEKSVNRLWHFALAIGSIVLISYTEDVKSFFGSLL
ncbi:MAG: hypothetical protein CMB64_01565 [Euryarchaeota archaeon]|nr:hypothetical protein [Euryarchaeota archaeon]